MAEVRALHFKSIVVKSEAGYPDERAHLTVCDCGGETWFVFTLETQDHPHMQCGQCNTVFCSKVGGCHEEVR